MELSDEALCQRVADRDEAAFDLLVERYRERPYRLAWSILRDAEDARDLSQEAFVRLYEAAASFRGRARFSTWFYRKVIGHAPGIWLWELAPQVGDQIRFRMGGGTRQERIMERFRQFQAMSPAERQRVNQNYERWRQMTPEERQRVREQLRQRRQFAPDDEGPRPEESRPGRHPLPRRPR